MALGAAEKVCDVYSASESCAFFLGRGRARNCCPADGNLNTCPEQVLASSSGRAAHATAGCDGGKRCLARDGACDFAPTSGCTNFTAPEPELSTRNHPTQHIDRRAPNQGSCRLHSTTGKLMIRTWSWPRLRIRPYIEHETPGCATSGIARCGIRDRQRRANGKGLTVVVIRHGDVTVILGDPKRAGQTKGKTPEIYEVRVGKATHQCQRRGSPGCIPDAPDSLTAWPASTRRVRESRQAASIGASSCSPLQKSIQWTRYHPGYPKNTEG
jgi:hypothetical protein